MDNIMHEFMTSSFYKELFNEKEIIMIYIGGSRSTDILDNNSDYDIVILTYDNDYHNVNKYAYILYKNNIKIHWYYDPINELFNIINHDCIYGCMQIKNLRDDIVLYKNPKYNDIIDNLIKIKDDLSHISCYKYFNFNKKYIESILIDGYIKEEKYSKLLYHLCLASYYITGETPDKDFLRSIKHIKQQAIREEYKGLVIERLNIYKKYIEQNPIDIDNITENLYKQVLKVNS